MINKRTVDQIRNRANYLNLRFSNRYWSTEEESQLTSLWPLYGSKCYTYFLQKTKTQVINKARAMNLYCRDDYWTEDELKILQNYYPTMGTECQQLLPGRSKTSIINKAHQLQYLQKTPWTTEEKDILTKYYLTHQEDKKINLNPLIHLLPNHTKTQIINEAALLQLTSNKRKPWTIEEDEILKQHYPNEGISCIKRLPGRTKNSISQRANKLSLNFESKITNWTVEEIDILKKYYIMEGMQIQKRLPSKTKYQIRAKVATLKLINKQKWLPQEDVLIQQHYPHLGSNIPELLLHHSRDAIVHRAIQLNIKYEKSIQANSTGNT